MSDTSADPERNADATRRLRELIAKLTDEDLAVSLGGGWTVAVALAHLAFWDGRQRGAVEHFTATGEPGNSESDDAVNVGLEPLALLVDARGAAELAVEAAAAADAAIEALSPEGRSDIVDSAEEHLVRRWDHREEHLAQIASVLER
jgi:hypothetical protein